MLGAGLAGDHNEGRHLEVAAMCAESHFLSQADSRNGVRMPDSPVAGELRTEDDLAELYLANLPQAYNLWLAGEGSHPPGQARRRGRATPS